MDRFRRQKAIPPGLWARVAGMNRSQFNKYRAGVQEPSSLAVAELVRAARKITNSPVRASHLFELGEDEPLNTTDPEPRCRPRKTVRKAFDTRLDHCLIREGISPGRLAFEADVSRQGLLKKRADRDLASVSFIARLVRTMRRMGRDVVASDLFDLGEDL